MRGGERNFRDGLILFVAEGFGSGRVPIAPGTFGTVVGFCWIYVLLIAENAWVYAGGTLAGFFLAVWLGARGEEILKKKDPGSIVIDEIAALPLAFLGAVLANLHGSWTPALDHYIHGKSGWIPVVCFVGFRFFDVAKPWLIHRAQDLPGGWGLVMDDFLAAVPVAFLTYGVARVL